MVYEFYTPPILFCFHYRHFAKKLQNLDRSNISVKHWADKKCSRINQRFGLERSKKYVAGRTEYFSALKIFL